MLDWTAEAALHSGVIDRAILSTDDDEIAEAGRTLGLDVPFLRPSDLAGDAALMLGVLQHCLAELRRVGEAIEAIVLLQPTSPFRRAHHVRECVAKFRETQAQTLVSVVRVPHRFVPEGQMREKEGRLSPFFGGGVGRVARQEKERLYARNGPAVLIVRSSVLDAGLLYGDAIVGYEMDEMSSFDIDTPEELRLADHLLRTGYVR